MTLRRSPRGLAIVPALLVVAALLPATASAGTYDVYACDANHGGGAAPSFAAVADPGMAAYDDCPAGGMVARSSWDGGTSTAFQGAYRIFDAPAGAVVQSISGYVMQERNNCTWGVGIVGGQLDLAGSVLFGFYPAPDCGVYGINWIYRDLAVNAPRVRLEARCGWGPCPRTGPASSGLPSVASTRMRDVRVVVRDGTQPSLTDGRGDLWTSDAWLRGVQTVAFDASDSTGISQARVLLDGNEVSRDQKSCDYLQRAPCPQGGLSTQLDTAAFHGDGSHTLTLEATDTAGNVSQVARAVKVDNTPPPPPTGLEEDGGEGWHSTNDFAVRWTNPVDSSGAPIAAAEYELCAVPKGDCVRGTREATNAVAIDHLRAPRPGEYELRVWLRDAAGNQDRRQAPPPVMVRLDDAPPQLAFKAADPTDPTLVAVSAVDSPSGVQSGTIELRRQGGRDWQALSTTVGGGLLEARLDDEHLASGIYDLRAHAIDFAGNERTIAATPDGRDARVALPLRLGTRLKVGVIRHTHGRAVLRPRSMVDAGYGHAVRLVGRLLTPDGNPVPDADVQVYTQTHRAGAATRLAATLKTSLAGGFTYRAPAGPSRTVRFRYPGTATVRATNDDVELLVHARTTLRSNRMSVVNGETLRFSGRLRGRGIPSAGKLVELQVLLRGRFRTFATTHTDRVGRWHYDYRFDGTRGRQLYRFKARVPREANYPYEPGHSRVVRVTVHGV